MNDRYIGGIECTSIEELGNSYEYIALGHIHKAQTFGQGRARYCGSPLPVGFDEVRPDYIHGFSVVEILPSVEVGKSTIRIENIPVVSPNPLVNIPSEGYAPWDEVMRELKAFPADLPAYIRLNVLLKDNGILPYDKEAQINSALEGKKGMFALINPTRELTDAHQQKEGRIKSLTMEELQKVEPATILREHAKLSGHIFTEDFEKMLEEVMSNINNTTGNED
jgi:exonuclease SbcD